jgi:hypothetical protein
MKIVGVKTEGIPELGDLLKPSKFFSLDQDLLSLKTLAEYQNQIITPRDFLDLD